MKTPRRTAAALVVASVALSVCGAEAAWRITADDAELFTLRNFARSKLSLFDSAYPSVHDPLLGWIPRPGYTGQRDNAWKTVVTIDADGFRENGAAPPSGPEVLAVGDSFTFGDEVDDADTYPARLEGVLGRRVVNAGVFGYGLDQSVLRAEQYLGSHAPSAVVLQAVRDDISRMQLSVRTGVEKPYFDLPRTVTSSGALRLNQVPTSERRPSIDDLGFVRGVLGYSYLVDWTMRNTGRAAWWYVGQWSDAYAYQDLGLATEIGCRLVARLGARMTERGIRSVFVLQYASHVLTLSQGDDPYIAPLKTVAACAERAGFAIVDTHTLWRSLAKSDPEAFRRLYAAVHLSPAGNARLAEDVANILRGERDALPEGGHGQGRVHGQGAR